MSRTPIIWNRKVPRLKLAAIKALQVSSKPMTINEIVTKIAANGWFTFVGKTPASSLFSVIARSNQKSKELKQVPLFERHISNGVVMYKLSLAGLNVNSGVSRPKTE